MFFCMSLIKMSFVSLLFSLSFHCQYFLIQTSVTGFEHKIRLIIRPSVGIFGLNFHFVFSVWSQAIEWKGVLHSRRLNIMLKTTGKMMLLLLLNIEACISKKMVLVPIPRRLGPNRSRNPRTQSSLQRKNKISEKLRSSKSL